MEKERKQIFKLIEDEIRKADSIVILGHENPDGDAIGSMLAMEAYIKDIYGDGKNVDIISKDLQEYLSFLEGFNNIKEKPMLEKYDLCICLDMHEADRLGDYKYILDISKKKVVMDHHIGDADFESLTYIDSNQPAACQIVESFFKDIGYEYGRGIAECIMAGILTDTGGFAYSNVNKETFSIAGRMLEKGVLIHELYKKLLNTITKNELELIKIALNRLEYFEEDEIVFTYLDNQLPQYVNMKMGEQESITYIIQQLQPIKVAIFARETDEGYKISLRSFGDINVRKIAEAFGGGGHFNASGCLIKSKDISQIKNDIVEEAKKAIK